MRTTESRAPCSTAGDASCAASRTLPPRTCARCLTARGWCTAPTPQTSTTCGGTSSVTSP
nr:MAG TPA: hypothetical protein [Caudoviricetes sp.]